VFFGATRATVTAASTGSLTVTVPLGATYQYLSVTNLASSLTGYSSKPFGVTLSGAVAFQPKADAGTGANPQSVAIGDVDGDGKPDLAVANNTDNTVSVLRNTSTAGAVSFATKVDYATSIRPLSVAIGDVDGDGKPDLATANLNNNNVSVLRNTGTAGTVSFATKIDYATGNRPFLVAIGDVDGDGKPDLATANYSDNTVSVLRNTSTAGTVSFATKVDYATGINPYSVAIGDVDGDGKPDLAVANNGSNTVSVLRNTGTAGTLGFAAKVDYGTGSIPYSVAIGDVDGDGKPDLAVANYSDNTVSVLRNTGTAGALGFATKVDYGTGIRPNSVAIGDVDGDGKPDLAVANFFTSNVSVLRQQVLLTGLSLSAGTLSPAFATGTLSYTAAVANATTSLTATPTANGTAPSPTVNGTAVASGSASGAITLAVGSNTIAVVLDGVSYTLTVTRAAAAPVPTLTSLNPTSGPVGTTILVNGSGFTGVSNLTFNGTPAPMTVFLSDTQLQTTVPAGATTGNVVVTAYGGNSNAVAFTVTTASTVTTATPASIASTSATLGGNVTADGSSAVTERGVVYVAGSGTPTTADTKLTASGTTGAFTVSATGLTASTLYTARAYAINGVGTAYGAAQPFTTSAAAPTSLTISTGTLVAPVSIPAGTYTTVTVTGTGNAILGGAVSVSTGLTVSSGGSLDTNCQLISGPGSFTLAAGATLLVCDANGINASGATGAVQVTGTRSFDADASYVYNGTVSQNTGDGLPAQVRNLTTTNNSPVTLSLPTSVAQALTIAGSGDLNLRGRPLTLLSNATGTALAVNSGTGIVGGNATVQRYLDGSLNPGLGYRHFSAPVSNTTVADLATAGFAPEVSQASAFNTSATPGTTTPFPTVFGYDQARLVTAATSNYAPFDQGFFVPAGLGTALTPGQGYAVNLAASQLVDFVGTLGTGDLARSLARNAGPTAIDAGWALVGNPYPAPLDWSLVATGDRTGLDASMYVFESSGPYAGTYRSYVNGVGPSSLIGSSQGFFVRVSTGNTAGTLTFRNAQRLTTYATQVPVRRGTNDPRPQLRLTLAGATGPTDALVLYAEAGATPGPDSQFDAVKLANPSGLNLAAVLAGGERLAIDGRPALTAATAVPLFVGVPAAGAYTFAVADLAHFAPGTRLELVDNLTGTRTALTAGAAYAFTTATTTAPGRFYLNLAPAGALATGAAALAAQVQVYPNPARGSFVLTRPAGTGAASAVLLNALGQVVRTLALPTAETRVDLAGLATGVYTLRLTLGGQPVAKRLVVE